VGVRICHRGFLAPYCTLAANLVGQDHLSCLNIGVPSSKPKYDTLTDSESKYCEGKGSYTLIF
jgi:hypothetical protein